MEASSRPDYFFTITRYGFARMAEPISPVQVASELIHATRQEELRRAAMRNKGWAKLLRGFRPQSVTKDLLITRAAEIAAAPGLLKDLAEAFLKSSGVPEGGSLTERLAAAAGHTDLPEGLRLACRQLAGVELPEDPPASPDGGTPPAEAEPEQAAEPQRPSRRRRARPTAQAE